MLIVLSGSFLPPFSFIVVGRVLQLYLLYVLLIIYFNYYNKFLKLNNIALGLDRILNKALKTCGLLIAPWLADIARACFATGYYLRLRRAMIMFVLHKKGKADYLLLGSY